MANENAPGASGTVPEVNPNPAAPAAGDPPQPAAAGAYTGPEWIPEALRGNKSLTKFKTAGDVAQAYVNLESRFGQKVQPPADNAPAEEKAAWRKNIGVPDKADEYEAPSMPKGYEDKLDQDYLGDFRGKAHEIGLSKSQAKSLVDWVVAREVRQLTEFAANSEKAKDEGMKALKTEWGAATADNVGLVQRLVEETGDADLAAALNQTGFGNHPAALRWMAKLGRTFVEHDLIDPKTVGTSSKDAQAKIDEIKAAAAKDRKHPWRDSSHPGHKAAVDEMNALYELANPSVEFSPQV